MIRTVLIAIGMACLSIACTNHETAPLITNDSVIPESDHLFDQEYGFIEFKHTGMNSGTEKLYWIDWGNKQYKEVKTVTGMGNFSQETEAYYVIIGNDNYNLDPSKKTGTLIKNEMFEGMSNGEKRHFGEELLTQMNGKKIGEETLLGRDCEIWDVKQMFAKVWIWNGHALKSEVEMMGMTQILEATKIDLDTRPESSLFDVSAYDIKEVEFPLGR